MNKRTQKSRKTARTKPAARSRNAKKSKASLDAMKDKINLIVIWTLVVVNGVLISSLVHRLIGETTPQGSVSLVENPITVEVQNGCGVAGIANQFAEIFKRSHCDVRLVGNAVVGNEPDFSYKKTVLIDRGKRKKSEIRELSRTLGLKKDRVLEIKNADYPTDVTLIVGADYDKLKAYKDYN